MNDRIDFLYEEIQKLKDELDDLLYERDREILPEEDHS